MLKNSQTYYLKETFWKNQKFSRVVQINRKFKAISGNYQENILENVNENENVLWFMLFVLLFALGVILIWGNFTSFLFSSFT